MGAVDLISGLWVATTVTVVGLPALLLAHLAGVTAMRRLGLPTVQRGLMREGGWPLYEPLPRKD